MKLGEAGSLGKKDSSIISQDNLTEGNLKNVRGVKYMGADVLQSPQVGVVVRMGARESSGINTPSSCMPCFFIP